MSSSSGNKGQNRPPGLDIGSLCYHNSVLAACSCLVFSCCFLLVSCSCRFNLMHQPSPKCTICPDGTGEWAKSTQWGDTRLLPDSCALRCPCRSPKKQTPVDPMFGHKIMVIMAAFIAYLASRLLACLGACLLAVKSTLLCPSMTRYNRGKIMTSYLSLTRQSLFHLQTW